MNTGVIKERPTVFLVGGEDHHLRIPFLCALRDQGFSVAAAGTCRSQAFRAANIPYVRYKFDRSVNPLADIRTINHLRTLVQRIKPHIIHSFDTKPNLFVPFAVRSLPDISVVRTINGLGWIYSSHTPMAQLLRPVYVALQRCAGRWTDVTVFQNRQDMSFFRSVGITTTARYIPGSGVDPDSFAAAIARGPTTSELRAELGLEGKRIVMTVTRLTREKGIPTLLQAAARVNALRDDVRFVLVGPRETEGRLAISQAELDAHRPYVMSLGYRSDVPQLLRMADVFAFPTEYREGIPRVLMEAALAGVPIVASRMPGCADVVDDGHGGFLIDPRSPEQLTEKILEVLDLPEQANSMAKRAGERVRHKLALPEIAHQYGLVYEQLLARSRDRSHANEGGEYVREPIL